jgi:Fe-S cluster assembly iron-binding protein IscA
MRIPTSVRHEGEEMLNITENAKRELKRILDTSVEMPQARLRLCDRGGGELGLGIDIEFAEDRVVEYEGSRILVIESRLASKLDDITLDIDETSAGPELVICGDFGN